MTRGFGKDFTVQSSLRAVAQEVVVRCRIAASATIRASADEITAWRRKPIEAGTNVPTSLLKHAEDQTVVALTAVLKAINDAGWKGRSFRDWGIVAGPNFLGRVTIATTIRRLQKEGAWGISPHLIPHQSLHAVSGTISQVLAIHGPNFGVGGGPESGPDAFLLAGSMVTDGTLPGLWLVMTGYETEWIPGLEALPPAPPCLGVALALEPTTDDSDARCLAIRHARPSVSPSALYPDFQLAAFADEVKEGAGQWRLSDSHWLELDTEHRP